MHARALVDDASAFVAMHEALRCMHKNVATRSAELSCDLDDAPLEIVFRQSNRVGTDNDPNIPYGFPEEYQY